MPAIRLFAGMARSYNLKTIIVFRCFYQLAERKSAVIARNLLRQICLESGSCQMLHGQFCQQFVLEHTAGQTDGIKRNMRLDALRL